MVYLFVLVLFDVDVDDIERDDDEPDKEDITSDSTDLSKDSNGGLGFLLILFSMLFNSVGSLSDCSFQCWSSSDSM